jgi:hypothetical protein
VANEVALGHTVKAHVRVGGKVIIKVIFETLLGRPFSNSAFIAWPTSSPPIQAVDKVAAKRRL